MKAGPGVCLEVEAAIETYRNGGMLLVLDDEHRENEGDLLVAAEKADPAKIHFMIREGGGLICIAMSSQRLARLGLARMAPAGIGDSQRTAFMESVDAREGTTTGISAFDRARTIEVLMDEKTRPDDLLRPGHLFPLEAVEGGVLARPGHTEAAVDLARLAGLKPAGVICEVIRKDGQMARRNDLIAFAAEHRLPMVSIADLIVYRRNREALVQRERTIRMPTGIGAFQLHLYRYLPDGEHHLALVLGHPETVEAPLVRVHSECMTGDVFGSQRCDCGAQLDLAMRQVAAEGAGVVVYLRQEGRGIGLAHKIHAYALQDGGMDTVEANVHLGFGADLRDYAPAAQILRHLGLRKIRALTNNPAKIEGLTRYGIEVVERLPLQVERTEHNRRYLDTKREKLGHWL
jgi:3,4-dihydroxy 2-butanone 4-phosphate synthase/GTP cyclohydrolase II